MADEWDRTKWPDGVEQYRYEPADGRFCYIERVDKPKSRRKQWRIADRRGTDTMSQDGLYPPTLSRPFKDLDQAKSVFLILLAAGQFD